RRSSAACPRTTAERSARSERPTSARREAAQTRAREPVSRTRAAGPAKDRPRGPEVPAGDEEVMSRPLQRPKVVIVGAGFGGLSAARGLARTAVDVTLIDRRNFHLFQPLL